MVRKSNYVPLIFEGLHPIYTLITMQVDIIPVYKMYPGLGKKQYRQYLYFNIIY